MKKYFNLDLHISVIADIKYIFKEKIEIVNWCLSSHHWVFEKSQDSVDIINQNTWMKINMSMVKSFQDRYDSFLQSFDGFIVGHPNVFVLLYEKYNKPIIMVNSCRYDMPFCFNNKNIGLITELHNCIRRLQKLSLLTVVSNNLADQTYIKMGIPDIQTSYIPSLCEYTKMQHNPMFDKFLLYSGEELIDTHSLIVKKKQLGRFNWQTICKFRGIIHIPYEASTMSIFEHISSGIPLLFPTKRFLKELWINKKVNFQSNYWRKFAGVTPPEYLICSDSYDFWLENADYYHFKGCYYFDSIEELFTILNDFSDVHKIERMLFINERKDKSLQKWLNIVC